MLKYVHLLSYIPHQALSTLDSLSLMYPFFYRPMFEVLEDGWNSFLPEEAFKDLESMVLM